MPEMSENDILRAVFSHLRNRPAPGVFAFHPKNESSDMRGLHAGIYTALGVESGVPDVIAIQAMYFDETLKRPNIYALELKKFLRKGKKLTPHEGRQKICRERLAELGVCTGIAYGLDEAVAWLEGHGLLRGESQLKVFGARP